MSSFTDNTSLATSSPFLSTIAQQTNKPDDDESLISQDGVSTGELAFIAISMTIMSLLVVLGNIFVIIIYYKNRKLQSPKNFFILSLAVADIIIGLIPVNFYTVYLMFGYWPMGVIVCNAWLVIDYWACTVSTLTLLAISYDRFYFTWFPVKHRVQCNRAYIKKVITIIWILAFLIWAPAILGYPHAVGQHTVPHDQCYIQFLLENGFVTFITAFCSYYGPVLFTTIAYGLVSYRLVNMGRTSTFVRKVKPRVVMVATQSQSQTSAPAAMPTMTSQEQQTEATDGISVIPSTVTTAVVGPTKSDNRSTVRRVEKNRQQKNAKKGLQLLLLIIVAFSISWMPYYLSTVIVSSQNIRLPERLWRFCYIVGWGNSFLNPLCYAFGSKHFKKGFIELITCARYKQKINYAIR
ncbi:muscarinic acetylcholine receptor M2-like [Clytia hemisphaerica]|uniref:muscarinic acetylcholine receptor M2-like n=1 Tax=Clytia hemisphaerica TaxID=252671 RepID=UPI0034D6AA02